MRLCIFNKKELIKIICTSKHKDVVYLLFIIFNIFLKFLITIFLINNVLRTTVTRFILQFIRNSSSRIN